MGKIVMRTEQYAPIEGFEIIQDAIPSGTIRGFAAPVNGSKPGALGLFAGSITIATAVASNFSTEAKDAGTRLGWCGFEIGGLAQAVTIGQDVELRCLVSGRVLAGWDGVTLATGLAPHHRKHLLLSEMLGRLRSAGACTDIEQILPFALALARTRGKRPFLDATYRYLLGRQPDSAAESRFFKDYTDSEAIRDCWTMIMDSSEYKSLNGFIKPAPFDSSFPFPLDVMDDRNQTVLA